MRITVGAAAEAVTTAAKPVPTAKGSSRRATPACSLPRVALPLFAPSARISSRGLPRCRPMPASSFALSAKLRVPSTHCGRMSSNPGAPSTRVLPPLRQR
jgi:hypothetical protein